MCRVWTIPFFLCVSAANAEAPCPAPDESFRSFLSHFQQDVEFRLARVDWPLRVIGATTELATADSKVERSLWSREWSAKLERDQLPLIPRTVSDDDCYKDDPSRATALLH